MDEKLRILLCEDDENLGMLLREYYRLRVMLPSYIPMEKQDTRLS